MAKAKNTKSKAVRRTSIGGQAVLEGVMMKGSRSIATAVRTASGDITVESKYIKSVKEKNVFFRLPFVRGVVNLVTQLFQGTGIILRSAEVYGDFAEPTKFDNWVAKKFKINPMNVLMAVSVVLGIALAVGLFVFLPNFLAGLICDNAAAIALSSLKSLWYSLIEGGIMIAIFISYILLVTLMKDVRRVFMYHGAEHKVISCYEHGLDLTVENARSMRREHSRCGTTFLFFVVTVSILVFVLINFMLEKCGLLVGHKVLDALIKLGFKLLFLPVVAGVSYELLKLLAKSDCLFVRILRAPGMALQKLTTKEPTDDMLEVSLTAFKTVMEMDENPNLPERKFEISVPYEVARSNVSEIAKGADDADLDWIFAEATGVKRSMLFELKSLAKTQYESATEIAKRMADGTPLQYAMGNADFYGIKISVNRNVLIPRPETEELCERAIAEISERQNRVENNADVSVLDLCTGSGAIAVTAASISGASVVASDISEGALQVAKANALNVGVNVEFVKSDMWQDIEGDFDVIISNPPYIPSEDINTLDERVKNFEPIIALDGGKDGLDFYRKIASGLDAHLKEDGVLLLEFGINQADEIKNIFDEYDVRIIKDMGGVERIALVERKV
ncbi:MAG: peptide chain release factor N(5)-glutamine methyltransferase [Bacteroides sp.]|nr:peptide chain release factor N(5)-glutamine methyltransferase [Bacillota bacterium]MCM1393352.1 peptide chain release factor N(5)-glutamine methyltransferase [[Eubacterium] siraeum]MCM1454906.1 peptide chain release factor N(5)-glutamine methyltransferase [Bacteroides sp.]